MIAFGNDSTHRLNDMHSLNLETNVWEKVSYTTDPPPILLSAGVVLPALGSSSIAFFGDAGSSVKRAGTPGKEAGSQGLAVWIFNAQLLSWQEKKSLSVRRALQPTAVV